MLIRDTLKRDLNRKIEEIIKVDQTDEAVVHEELTEYVVTPAIKDFYYRVFSSFAEGPTTLSESIGIWVSGFFGSGKSSFIKNLGYVLEDSVVLGDRAVDLFARRIEDQRVLNLVDVIHSKFPVKIIMFDIQSDRAVGTERRSIAHYMYRVLLRELGYAEDFDIAELEMTLESDGKLDDFTQKFQSRYRAPWGTRRKLAGKFNEASAILQEMDPATYPVADSWAKSVANREVEATPSLVVERSYELMRRRLPGHALVYIIDEVGQYIARSSDRIEDLRRIVELLGLEGRRQVQAKSAVSSVWLVATSQERLDEVTSAIGDTKVQLAKVQDRFPIRVDLSPTDIREIVVKRVLAKKPECVADIQALFEKTEGALKTHAALERTHRRQEFEPGSFTDFHPYLPHHIDTLSIDVVSGIRRQPGADRTIGGATRTIIKQAYEMLVNDRTRLADQPIGTLVTLDKLFELLEGSLSAEIRKDVDDVGKKFPDDKWSVKVMKAVALMSFVSDLPRTAHNISALLYPSVDAPSPLKDIEAAIGSLVEAQHLRDSEDGYKILTAQEKTWRSRKHGIEVKPRQREELLGQLLERVFDEPALKAYRYENRNFPINAVVRGVASTKGGIVVEVRRSDSPDRLPDDLQKSREDSRKDKHPYWLFPLTAEIDTLVADLVRSSEMIREYENLRAQNKITADESASLDDEKREAGDAETRLRGKLVQALTTGQLLFNGVAKDGSALGSTAQEVLKKFLDGVVPDLYPNLPHAAVSPGANDAENILKAANLDAVPTVFGESGLKLFVRSGAAVTFNDGAPSAVDVLKYLKDRVDYGEKPNGAALDEHFSGPGFGWETDVLRVVLAGLFRAGQVRITTGGRTHEDYTNQQSWSALTKLGDFKRAAFAPQTPIGVADLVQARKAFTDLTGKDVDVDQQKISRALKDFVREELADVPGLIAEAKARSLPLVDVLEAYQQELTAIEREDVQKQVALLAQEGAALKKRRDNVSRLRATMTPENLTRLSGSQAVVTNVWPALQRVGGSEDLESTAAELRELLNDPELFTKLNDVQSKSDAIHRAFASRLDAAHSGRNEAYADALDRLRGDERLSQISDEDKEALMRPLAMRSCYDYRLEVGQTACASCRASLDQIESDVAAAGQYETAALRRIAQLTAPEAKPPKIVKASRYFSRVETEEDVQVGVQALKDELLKALSEDTTIIVE